MTHFRAAAGSPALELVSRAGRNPRTRASLLFVHGINVGAWVWEEHFLPYFADAGYDVHALSLRGHGASDGRDRLNDWRLRDYVADVAAAVDHLGAPIILVGHSLGGAVVQAFVRQGGAVAGMALLASVPPWGLAATTWRMSVTDPVLLQAMAALSSHAPGTPVPDVVKQALFSPDIPPTVLDTFAARAGAESPWTAWDVQGWPPLAPLPWAAPPTFVLGGLEDRIISADEVWWTGLYYGGAAELIPLLAHALMVDPLWEVAAARLRDWLRARFG